MLRNRDPTCDTYEETVALDVCSRFPNRLARLEGLCGPVKRA